jgi:hypothetical protein
MREPDKEVTIYSPRCCIYAKVIPRNSLPRICFGRWAAWRGGKENLRYMNRSVWKLAQRVRSEKGGFSAVDGGTVLLDKKTPAEEVLEAVLNPSYNLGSLLVL